MSMGIRHSTGLTTGQYLGRMASGKGDDPRTWGGVLEASILAQLLSLRITIFEEVAEGFLPLTSTGVTHSRHILVLWTGAHYTILKAKDMRKVEAVL